MTNGSGERRRKVHPRRKSRRGAPCSVASAEAAASTARHRFSPLFESRTTGHLFSQARNYIVSRSGLYEPRARDRDDGQADTISPTPRTRETKLYSAAILTSDRRRVARFCADCTRVMVHCCWEINKKKKRDDATRVDHVYCAS